MASNKSVDDAVERAALVLMPNTVRYLGLSEAVRDLCVGGGRPAGHFLSQIFIEYRKMVSQ